MTPDLTLPGPASAPHRLSSNSVAKTMLTVVATLVPATLFAFWLYGWPAIFLWSVTVLAALAGEAFCLRLAGRPAMPTLADGSALLTGWLLALSLPPWAPWWIGACGALFAVVLAKQVFGGIGFNLFNPAMVARVFLLVSFPVHMTQWVGAAPIGTAASPGFHDGLQIVLGSLPLTDATASATLLGHARTELARGGSLLELFAELNATGSGNPAAGANGLHGLHGRHGLISLAGARAGSLGETASLLIALGGVVLLARRIISWHIPLAVLAGIALPALVAHAADPARHLDAGTQLLSGGALLGAFYIATDYVTSPNTRAGQLVFGLGCGLLTFVIRTWGGYPEGVAFAVLIMNALTPVIDRYVKPRILGRNRRGAPLDAAVERARERPLP